MVWLQNKINYSELAKNYTSKRKKIDSYIFRWNHGDYAYFFIDADSHVLVCDSSFGVFNYHFAANRQDNFKHFLTSLEGKEDYLLSTFAKEEFDLEKTVHQWRKRIINYRRDSTSYVCSKEQAREMWDIIDDLETECSDGQVGETIFCHKIEYNDVFQEVDCEWWDNLTINDYSPSSYIFADVIYPMLVSALRLEKN